MSGAVASNDDREVYYSSERSNVHADQLLLLQWLGASHLQLQKPTEDQTLRSMSREADWTWRAVALTTHWDGPIGLVAPTEFGRNEPYDAITDMSSRSSGLGLYSETSLVFITQDL